MYYVPSTNQYLREGVAFELNAVQYPANFLTLDSADEKAALELQEVIATGPRPDDRYYWVTEQLQGATLSYVATPKDLTALKAQCTATIKQCAYSLLLPTDYMAVRAVESGLPIPEDWKTWRANVRICATTTVTAIQAASTVDALMSCMAGVVWPLDPDAATQKVS